MNINKAFDKWLKRVSNTSPTKMVNEQGAAAHGILKGMGRKMLDDAFNTSMIQGRSAIKGTPDGITAWKKAKAMKLTDADFELMANDITHRKTASPDWFNKYALGICKHLEERIWLTPLPMQQLTKEDEYEAIRRQTAIELGLTPATNSGNQNTDFIEGVTYEQR